MERQPESVDRPISASLKATYRALLARGLEAGEAANLTAFLHGLPSTNFEWTLPEVEAIVHRRMAHAAEVRKLAKDESNRAGQASASRRPVPNQRRPARSGSTHAIGHNKA